LPIVVEWSNECWNWGYTQAQWNDANPAAWPDGTKTTSVADAYRVPDHRMPFTVAELAAPNRPIVRMADAQAGWWHSSRHMVEDAVPAQRPDLATPVAIAPDPDASRGRSARPDRPGRRRPEADAFAPPWPMLTACSIERPTPRRPTVDEVGEAEGYPIHIYECGFSWVVDPGMEPA